MVRWPFMARRCLNSGRSSLGGEGEGDGYVTQFSSGAGEGMEIGRVGVWRADVGRESAYAEFRFGEANGERRRSCRSPREER